MSGYPAYRTPRDDRSRLCVPELDQVSSLIDDNRQLFDNAACCWMDVPLSTIRQWAREETLIKARAYTQGYLSEESDASSHPDDLHSNEDRSNGPLILSGHQPELFHPGVWFKNFLLSSIAKNHFGVGINILVDHDLARTFTMNVPLFGPDGLLHKDALSVDEDSQSWPWEYTLAKDITKWQSFLPEVVDRLLSVGIAEPMLGELWPKIMTSIERGNPIGEALSAARHSVERSNGLHTLELPFSRLAIERSFACFVGEFLSRIESVHESYHAARHAYRLHHRIKNRLQPIPKLARDDDWYEAPFWVYSASDPTRRALWVRRDADRLQLSDRQGWQSDFPSGGSFDAWFAEWRKLGTDRVSIRPRALTTTTFLRLAVGDLFIHGIGGGKYDQMTDQIMRSLWSISAPHYLVATTTLHLPMAGYRMDATKSGDHSEAEVIERARQWRFSPDRLVNYGNSNGELDALLEEKRKLLTAIPSGTKKSTWHSALQQLNASIRDRLSESDASLAELLRQAQNREREQKILNSREFSIALFPTKWIVDCLRTVR